MTLIRLLCGPLIATGFATIMAAQEAPSPPPMPTAVPSSPPPAAPTAPVERLVSHHLAEVLAASMPKYHPVVEKTEAAAPAPAPANPEGDKPANEIVRLPSYIVSAAKLPSPVEVMTKTELEHYAMDHYLGPEDGFDRGFLNLFTIAGAWKKIPLLGSFPFASSETNEDRAMRLYGDAQRKQKMDDLTDLMNLPKTDQK